ncbi:hypothetical protein GIB67_000860 [Kingdonia uniflora]|uniref:Smr domain-containing protein n=1 Tax=Kingdonia uniflora TaxID=39325 RepID=A0A7J7LG10_9MAGN|nr:hypothetical protein GIB67_000860 [Kingdonia uniflora]
MIDLCTNDILSFFWGKGPTLDQLKQKGVFINRRKIDWASYQKKIMRDGQTSKMTSAGPSSSKNSWARGRSPGWAAFDLEQREKQGIEPKLHITTPPFPNMTTFVSPSKTLGTRNTSSAKSFSSVLQPSRDFPVLTDSNKNSRKEVIVGDSSHDIGNRVENYEEQNNFMLACEQLKELHSWADDSLIDDVLGAVDNDFNQASTLLKSMVLSDTSEVVTTQNLEELRYLRKEYVHKTNHEHANNSVPLETMKDLTILQSSLEEHFQEKKIEGTGKGVPVETKLSESTAYLKLILGYLKSAPVEPEWEEDDVYLSNRKDAITAIRSAVKHSKAASNAFLRGDHISAQQLSVKASSEWIAADKLNAKAAQEILSIRNSENGVWKLDLHGLHASEAVRALEEHLWEIETDRVVKPNVGINQPVLESFNRLTMEAKIDKKRETSWQRPSVLQVITGTGNHSRGQAALPAAIRAFLIEHGYRFDETRPGMVAVRPKFRACVNS